MVKYLCYLLISGLVLALDQLTKFLTVSKLSLGETVSFIKGVFSFTYVRNTGAAWSFMAGKSWFPYVNIVFSILVVVGILYYLKRAVNESNWFSLGLALVMAGAAGNCLDRLLRGYVVDMLQTDFVRFPIFNVADISLTVGAICIAIYVIVEEKQKAGNQV